jgi:hypothetical protein
MRLIYLYLSKRPNPKSSTPQLFDTIVKSFVFLAYKARIRFSGQPDIPNPPTNRVYPSEISFTASSALANIF